MARSRSRSRSQKPRRSRGGFYGPAQAGDFAEWAGLSKSHAQRLWDEVADELIEVEVEKDTGSLMADDRRALESPPAAQGIRLIPPPGDPFLQTANRSLLVPERNLRKRLFRPVASPGAVLDNGRLRGLWRVKTNGAKAELTVEKTGRLKRRDLEEEAQRVAKLRGVAEAAIVLA